MRVCLNLLEVLERIHSRGYVHNDLKYDNVIVDPTTCKTTIIDLGNMEKSGVSIYATPSDEPTARTKRATMHSHLCPELYLGGPCQPAGDIYSVSQMVKQAFVASKNYMTPCLVDVLVRCQQEEASGRPTIQEFMAALVEEEVGGIRKVLRVFCGLWCCV